MFPETLLYTSIYESISCLIVEVICFKSRKSTPWGTPAAPPNLGLEPDALSLATPPRDNISSLVDYMKNPTSYDGLESIAEVHPSIKSADIFPKMRSLNDEDLFAIGGHILLQPKLSSEKWGGGKIYY